MNRTLNNNPVWDISTRLCHWLIVLSIFGSWLSFETGRLDIHAYCGYTTLTLLLFRVAWGFIGSPHSRFSDFVKSPFAIIRYLKGSDKEKSIGHNPLGGWSVLALLAIMFIQGASGLFNTDDILFSGPYYASVSSEMADRLGGIHAELFYYLLGFIALHIGAVLFYDIVKKQGLIKAMLNGYKPAISGKEKPALVRLAITTLCCCAGVIFLVVYLAPDPVYLY